MVTKAETRQDVADIFFSKDRFRRGTANSSGNSATLLVDDSLKAGIVRPTRLIDAWVLITSGVCEGGIAGITQYDQATGSLTLDSGLFVDPGEGFTYELFYPPFEPTLVEGKINEFMRRTRVDTLWLPSLLGDSELDAAYYSADGTGVTTDNGANTLTDLRAEWVVDEWVGHVVTCNAKTITVTGNTATVITGSGGWSADPGNSAAYTISRIDTDWPTVVAVVTKEYTADAANVYLGEKSIYLAGVATNGFKSAVVDVLADEKLLVSIIARSVGANATISLRNAAGTTTYDSADLYERAFTQIKLTETLAETTVAQVRLYVVLNGAGAVYISAPIVMQSRTRRDYVAPAWLVSEGQVLEAVAMGFGTSATQDQTYYPLTGSQRARAGISWLRSDRAANPMRARLQNTESDVLAFVCQRPLAELRQDSDTSPVNREYAAAGVAARVLKTLGIPEWKTWNKEARMLAHRHDYNRSDLRGSNPLVSVR